MEPPDPRRLVVNADDFGRSSAINEAVIRAHREGILTTASLMVNESAAAEAVALANAHPKLGVGLHLTLVRGKAALPPERAPDLVNSRGEFSQNPVAAGFRYFVSRTVQAQLQQEIQAQFERFERTNLKLDHVNGHLHMHLHPTVFAILIRSAAEWGITHLRLTRDPLLLNRRLARGRLVYRGVQAMIHGRLAARAAPLLKEKGIKHTNRVFGLLQNARMDETYISNLLNALPEGDSELYSHPALDQFNHEFDALVSPRVKSLVTDLGVDLIRYQDL
jgi:hopanoid biosynthesis associated protein HpnK